MRILLTEGSGLTSRQTAPRLSALGHTVGVLSTDPIGLTRFTRAVSAWHRTAQFGADPFAWLDAALDVAVRHRYHLMLPTQEQVTVLSWADAHGRLGSVRTVVPAFESLRAMQDKLSAHATLERLGLPRPDATVLYTLEDLAMSNQFPVYVKTPIGTAATGVWRLDTAHDRADLLRNATVVEALGREGGGLLAQRAVEGPLVMLQSVFDQGRLVAFHANLRVREGARGGASHKRSVVLPAADSAIDTLGRTLHWHGALSADAIVTVDGPLLIDINPRLVEPVNAFHAGVDLVGALVDVAMERHPPRQAVGRPDVATHQLLLAVLGAAQHEQRRQAILAELRAAAGHTDAYTASIEELTPVRDDWRAGIPTATAALVTLLRPGTWQWFAGVTVANYAISPAGWRAMTE